MSYVVGFALTILLVLFLRNEFRSSLKPMQLVGAKIGGKVRNVSILTVNNELKVVTVMDPTDKKKYDVTFSNIYAPTFYE